MKFLFSALFLLLFHIIGLVGIMNDPGFVSLTPFHLLVSLVLLLFCHTRWNKHFLIFLFSTAIFGFLAEVAGVNTGVLFGNYHYSGILGPKIMDTPIIIALNWLMLIYTTGVITGTLPAPVWIKILGSALLLVLIDFTLEPFAIKYNLWAWESSAIPLKNYITWFLLGMAFSTLFHLLSFNKKNPVAFILYFSQLFFFFALG